VQSTEEVVQNTGEVVQGTDTHLRRHVKNLKGGANYPYAKLLVFT
jgi:hypothetical protein